MVKVFLTGGDNMGWALDEDLKLMNQVLRQIPGIELVDINSSEVIHSCSPSTLRQLPVEKLIGKKIICQMPGEPFRYFQQPDFPPVASRVGLWLPRTRQAQEQFNKLGLLNCLLPYVVDHQTFSPTIKNKMEREQARRSLGLPENAYIIGSFQRDTEGADLVTPKYMKGPDVFLEIVHALHKKNDSIHVLLAGPRRFWLLDQLETMGIPHTYIGQITQKDDISVNILPRTVLNQLYNVINCYVVSSRTEGGPHAVLEAMAAGCPIISTPVGLALDALPSENIYSTVASAVKILETDMKTGGLTSITTENREHVLQGFSLEKVTPKVQECYEKLDDIQPYFPLTRAGERKQHSILPSWFRVPKVIKRSMEGKTVVGLWHTYHKPPYGGGNQFMLAMRKELTRQGVVVVENQILDSINYYFLNSIHFDVNAFSRLRKKKNINVLHRIDGPIYLIRGYDREKDELCYDLNAELASVTVLQSNYVYRKIVEFGYQPVRPIIIHNAVDSQIFNTHGKLPFDGNRKIRLISTSWSGNPRKGGAIYRWIEEHLDWNLFEYTFVGNVSEPLNKINHIPPMPSEDLAQILKQHDIYITASENDPCSNALLEALSCGLPALYLNSGGHPELVGMGGLPFEGVDDVLTQLNALVNNYENFKNLIVVPTMEQVAVKYLDAIRMGLEK